MVAGFAVLTTVVFAVALGVSQTFSPEARLMPQLVSAGGLIMGLVLVWAELRTRRDGAAPRPGWTHDVTIAVMGKDSHPSPISAGR